MTKLLLLLLLPLLAACGGGGGGNSTAPAPPPAPREIDFTFFGQSDPVVSGEFTSVYHAVDWGSWATPQDREAITQRIIAELQAARARGVDRFIVSVGFLAFDWQCRFLGVGDLLSFKARLSALDLARSVWMLYPWDEPELHGCDSDAELSGAYAAIRQAWGDDVRIGVIYGPNGPTPGISQVTDAGRDWYQHGPQALPLRPDQHLMLVAGGANPYREDPQQYVAYAQAHSAVSLVWAFLFVDYVDPQGRAQLGIALNGMLQAYRRAGCALTQKC